MKNHLRLEQIHICPFEEILPHFIGILLRVKSPMAAVCVPGLLVRITPFLRH